MGACVPLLFLGGLCYTGGLDIEIPEPFPSAEHYITLSEFEELGAGWAIYGSSEFRLSVESPRSGKRCLLIKSSEEVRLKHPFLIHKSFTSLEVFVRSSVRLSLKAELSDGREVLFKPDEQGELGLEGRWTRYTLDCSNIQPRKIKTYFGLVEPEPLYLRGLLIKLRGQGTVELDKMRACSDQRGTEATSI